MAGVGVCEFAGGVSLKTLLSFRKGGYKPLEITSDT